LQWHVAPCLWVLQPESCGGDDLRGDAVLLGLAAGAVGWVVVECGVGCRIGGYAVADGGAGSWGRGHPVFEDSWLHSDMKDMAYFYVYKLYEQLIQKGDLK